MFFLDALGIWVVYAFGIGTLVWAVAFIIGGVIVLRQRKKEDEEWERTEGAEQRRIQNQINKERYKALGMTYYCEEEDTKQK